MKKKKQLHEIEWLMKDEFKRDKKFIRVIVRAVSNDCNIPIPDMLLKSRKRELVQARQIAMTIASILTSAALSRVGSEIGGKDHATVLHARKTIFNLYDTDSKIRILIKKIIKNVCMHTSDSLVCQICGGSDIQRKAWIDPNTRTHTGNFDEKDPMDNYCRKCKTYVKFTSLSAFLTYDGQHTVAALSD